MSSTLILFCGHAMLSTSQSARSVCTPLPTAQEHCMHGPLLQQAQAPIPTSCDGGMGDAHSHIVFMAPFHHERSVFTLWRALPKSEALRAIIEQGLPLRSLDSTGLLQVEQISLPTKKVPFLETLGARPIVRSTSLTPNISHFYTFAPCLFWHPWDFDPTFPTTTVSVKPPPCSKSHRQEVCSPPAPLFDEFLFISTSSVSLARIPTAQLGHLR